MKNRWGERRWNGQESSSSSIFVHRLLGAPADAGKLAAALGRPDVVEARRT